jgi:aspartate ammonia-lyase
VTVTLAAELVPVLGYERCTAIAKEALAKEALATGRGVYELVLEKQWMTRDALDRALNPAAMVGH